MSLGSADSVRRASNNGAGQFKAIFQVQGKTFRPIFFDYFIADWFLYNFDAGSFHTTKFLAHFIRLKLNFIPKNWKIGFEPPFGGLRGNVRTPSIARWKARVDFQFVITKLFRYLLWLKSHKRKFVSRHFSKGWVTLSADFRGKGTSLTNECWWQKTRVIAVSWGIKISFAGHQLVLSQYTRLTDGETNGQTDRQNCDSNTMRCITSSHTVKIRSSQPCYIWKRLSFNFVNV